MKKKIQFQLLNIYVKVGGVFSNEFDSATAEKSKIDGHLFFLHPIKSSRIINMATPAGPIFFCTPANIIPYYNKKK